MTNDEWNGKRDCQREREEGDMIIPTYLSVVSGGIRRALWCLGHTSEWLAVKDCD